jgi:uncharacterized membrane protein required for colicin V production
MKLSRIILLVFGILAAIYLALVILTQILHYINNWLDNLVINPQW